MKNKKKTGAEKVLFSKQLSRKDQNLLYFIIALKECLKKMPFEKVSVNDICTQANKSRQTFYRCCENKYDLVNKYFEKIILYSYELLYEGHTVAQALTTKFNLMETEKPLFAQAFQTQVFDGLHRYTHRFIYNLYQDMYRRIDDKDSLDLPEHMDHKLSLLLHMHCEGAIYMTIQWCCSEIICTPPEIALLLVQAMPEKLKTIYRSYLEG